MKIESQRSSAMKAFAIGYVLLACGLSACSKETNGTLPSTVTRSFEEAMASDDPSKIAALFTADAEMLTQELPTVKGRENIQQYLADQVDPMVMFDTTTEMSQTSGNLAVETGIYTFRDMRRAADIETGKYMHVWKKEGEDWKLYRAMFNTDEPTTGRVMSHEGP